MPWLVTIASVHLLCPKFGFLDSCPAKRDVQTFIIFGEKGIANAGCIFTIPD
jgi:hypothetical protein